MGVVNGFTVGGLSKNLWKYLLRVRRETKDLLNFFTKSALAPLNIHILNKPKYLFDLLFFLVVNVLPQEVHLLREELEFELPHLIDLDPQTGQGIFDFFCTHNGQILTAHLSNFKFYL